MMDQKELVKRIAFAAMTDGGLYHPKSCHNAYFAMNMKAENRDFVEWVRDTLSHITTATITDVVKDGGKPQLRVESRTHPFFTKIRKRMYVGTYKSLDHHALKLLDGEALAIMYMADGNSGIRPTRRYVDVTLNLCNFCYSDQLVLKKVLKEILGLEFNVNGHSGTHYRLRLRGKDSAKFFDLVRPYILSSFAYKIPSEGLAPVRPYRFKDEQDDEIVRTTQGCVEAGRNDQSFVTE